MNYSHSHHQHRRKTHHHNHDHRNAVGRPSSSASAPATSGPPREIPISLGKPSFRRRLEAYYSLINPETIANPSQWLPKLDQIYQKYGGTTHGEQTLATKLAKKYGNTVRLKIAPAQSDPSTTTHSNLPDNNNKTTTLTSTITSHTTHSEEWYELTDNERNSGVCDVTSPHFDPSALLQSTSPEENEVLLSRHPYLQTAPLLDNLFKTRYLLPPCDPQHLQPQLPTTTTNATNKKTTTPKTKKLPVFSALAERYALSGSPILRVLYDCHTQRKRIRVMVRYVDCIRGVLTGRLLAFDKHWNMILVDVDEVYSPRVTTMDERNGKGGGLLSNAEWELKRRRLAMEGGKIVRGAADVGNLSSSLRVMGAKVRYCKQILVRGDNIVSVWRVDGERGRPPPAPTPITAAMTKGDDDKAANRRMGGDDEVRTTTIKISPAVSSSSVVVTTPGLLLSDRSDVRCRRRHHGQFDGRHDAAARRRGLREFYGDDSNSCNKSRHHVGRR